MVRRLLRKMLGADLCACDALIDIAIEVPTGLGNPEIKDFKTAKAVLRHIALRLSVDEVLARIGLSDYPAELLAYSPHIYGDETRQLRTLARSLLKQKALFESDVLLMFADRYWPAAHGQKLDAADYAGAWNVVKMACLGNEALNDSVDWLLPQLVGGEPIGLYVSIDCGRRMVQDMHAVMARKGLIPDVLEQLMPDNVAWEKDWPAGINVAVAIDGYGPEEAPELKAHGLQALAIARFVSTKGALLDEMEPQYQVPAICG